MSEMKTANPRIPSPFDTAGILQDVVLTPTLPLKIHVDRILHKTGADEGQLDVWKRYAPLVGSHVHCNLMTNN